MSGRSTTAPRVGGGLVARERLELRVAAALADEALLAILAGANSTDTAGALLAACGTVQQSGAREHRRLTPSVDDITLTERLRQAMGRL